MNKICEVCIGVWTVCYWLQSELQTGKIQKKRQRMKYI